MNASFSYHFLDSLISKPWWLLGCSCMCSSGHQGYGISDLVSQYLRYSLDISKCQIVTWHGYFSSISELCIIALILLLLVSLSNSLAFELPQIIRRNTILILLPSAKYILCDVSLTCPWKWIIKRNMVGI